MAGREPTLWIGFAAGSLVAGMVGCAPPPPPPPPPPGSPATNAVNYYGGDHIAIGVTPGPPMWCYDVASWDGVTNIPTSGNPLNPVSNPPVPGPAFTEVRFNDCDCVLTNLDAGWSRRVVYYTNVGATVPCTTFLENTNGSQKLHFCLSCAATNGTISFQVIVPHPPGTKGPTNLAVGPLAGPQ